MDNKIKRFRKNFSTNKSNKLNIPEGDFVLSVHKKVLHQQQSQIASKIRNAFLEDKEQRKGVAMFEKEEEEKQKKREKEMRKASEKYQEYRYQWHQSLDCYCPKDISCDCFSDDWGFCPPPNEFERNWKDPYQVEIDKLREGIQHMMDFWD